MLMTVRTGPWTIAVQDEWVEGFTFEPSQTTRHTFSVETGRSFGSVHASVEVRRSSGGLMPHALLGGELRPSSGGALKVTIPTSGQIRSFGTGRPGLLGNAELTPGLPDEFVEAIVKGIGGQQTSLLAGDLQIRQAGYDPIESSSDIFRRASALLVRVLVAKAESSPNDRIREMLRTIVSRS